MAGKKVVDMTTGSPARHILNFAIPTLLGFLFQQFYNLMDTVIIGRLLGTTDMAAVGSTGAINFLVLGFCIGLCNGMGIPVAQSFGAKDYSALRKYVANAIWVGASFAVIITTFVAINCKNILIFMNTPTDILESANAYIFIIFLGIPIVILYNLCASIIRSLGDSRTPVYFLVLSSVLNIGLDLVLIRPLGIAGPALATVVSQTISGTLCLIYIIRKFDILHLSKEELPFKQRYALRLISMGLPMGLQYSITAIGSVVLQTAVNGLGSIVVASMTAGQRISMFFCCPFDALGSTAATFTGQNMGARRADRIHRGMWTANFIGFAYSIFAFFILFFFGSRLSLLFMDTPDPVVMANVGLFLKCNVSIYMALAAVNIVRFTIQGMGYSALAILSGVFEMIARAGVGFLLVPRYGFKAACFANPSAWVLADIFLFIAFYVLLGKIKRRFATES